MGVKEILDVHMGDKVILEGILGVLVRSFLGLLAGVVTGVQESLSKQIIHEQVLFIFECGVLAFVEVFPSAADRLEVARDRIKE